MCLRGLIQACTAIDDVMLDLSSSADSVQFSRRGFPEVQWLVARRRKSLLK